MGLELATYISDLVPTNPSGLDQKSQGDDHIRLIKTVLQNTFPSANSVQSFGNWSKKDSGYLLKNVDYTQATTDNGKSIYFDCSGGARTYSLLPAATAGNGFIVQIAKDGGAAPNALTIDPNGAELINGGATLALGPNADGWLVCSGTDWRFFGNGTVQGAATSVDNSIALWSGTGGNTIKAGPALGTTGQVLTSNGAAPPSFQTLTIPAGVTPASQAEMESEANVGKFAQPNLVRNSPGVAKAYCRVTAAGVLGVKYNVTSVTKNGTGDYTINFTTPFSSGNYIYAGGAKYAVTDVISLNQHDSVAPTASAFRLILARGNGAQFDADFTISFFGDQ